MSGSQSRERQREAWVNGDQDWEFAVDSLIPEDVSLCVPVDSFCLQFLQLCAWRGARVLTCIVVFLEMHKVILMAVTSRNPVNTSKKTA